MLQSDQQNAFDGSIPPRARAPLYYSNQTPLCQVIISLNRENYLKRAQLKAERS
jgi:hypothetical protein